MCVCVLKAQLEMSVWLVCIVNVSDVLVCTVYQLFIPRRAKCNVTHSFQLTHTELNNFACGFTGHPSVAPYLIVSAISSWIPAHGFV